MLANRLSADPATKVLLLEAGGQDDWFWIDIPVGYLYTIANPRTDWCYKTQPDEHLANRSIHYARGKVLGGCSTINAMIYMRGQKEDYDYWASLGNEGWSWNDVLPLFKKVEDYQHGADEMHGAGGELRVEDSRLRWEILEAWRDAAEECGIPKIREFNRGDNFGSAFFQMNQKRGVRWHATKAFLRPALSRPNLTVMTHALVERVRIGGSTGPLRAEGIEFSHPRQGRCFAQATAEIILAAGSIGSPQLLQLSGIGPAALLAERGITPVHDLAGVGANLHDHLQIRMQYKVKNTSTLNERANSLIGKAAMALEYALFKTGPSDDAALPARRIRQERSGPAHRQHRMARAAALARQVRRSAPRVSRHHAERLQLETSIARLGAHRIARPRCVSRHQAELSVRPRRSPHRGRCHAVHTAHHGGQGACAIRAGGVPARCRRRRQTTNWREPRASWARRSFIR